MDFEKLAYDLAIQYTVLRLTNIASQCDTKEEQADALLNAFRFAHTYYLEQFGLAEK